LGDPAVWAFRGMPHVAGRPHGIGSSKGLQETKLGGLGSAPRWGIANVLA
jgi:hypothetical protein